MDRGIPLSPDRIVYRRKALLVTIAFIGGGFVVFWLVARGMVATHPSGPPPELEVLRKQEKIEEVGEAYHATQGFVLQQLDQDKVDAVEWGHRGHEGNRGWYKFNGELTVTDLVGTSHELSYTAVVQRDDYDVWQLEEISVSGDIALK